MAVLVLIRIMLIVAYYEVALVLPSSNNFQDLLPFASKKGFMSDKRYHHVESLSHGVCFTSRVQHSPDEYYLSVSIGTTNPSLFTAIIDTGSDLTWTQCQPCKNKCLNQTTPVFNPKTSSTYAKVKCSNNMCNSNFKQLPTSCRKHGVCEYKITYADGGYTGGVLARETFTFEGNVSIPKLYFGCGFENHDDINNGYPGLLGLGRGNLSFVSQMKASQFSYCLPSYRSNKSGNFSMGCQVNIPSDAKATPIIKNRDNPSKYYVSLERISIGNTVLPINHTKFEIQKDGTGGMFIDSGTTLTLLEESSFDQVTKELTRQLMLPSFIYHLETDIVRCYNITSCTNTKNFPNFVFHFKDSDFVVKPENYFNISADKKFGCLMMASSGFDGSLFGNYQQQNALLVYDLVNDKLFFLTDTKCT